MAMGLVTEWTSGTCWRVARCLFHVAQSLLDGWCLSPVSAVSRRQVREAVSDPVQVEDFIMSWKAHGGYFSETNLRRNDNLSRGKTKKQCEACYESMCSSLAFVTAATSHDAACTNHREALRKQQI